MIEAELSRQALRLFTFHSLAGGAGRTTLGLRAAWRLAEDNPEARVWFIEANLHGTSVVDVLDCCAPIWGPGPKLPERLPLHTAPRGFCSLTSLQERLAFRETCEARRRGAPFAAGVPFLNDFLLHCPPDWDAKLEVVAPALGWRISDSPDNLRLIPASPLPQDMAQVEPVLCDEHHGGFLEGRFEYLLDVLLAQGEGPLYVCIEAPRDLAGLSRALLTLVLRLASVPMQPLALDDGRSVKMTPARLRAAEIQGRAVLVLTPPGDLRRAPRWLKLRTPEEEPLLVPLFNRVPPGWAPVDLSPLLAGAPRIEEGALPPLCASGPEAT